MSPYSNFYDVTSVEALSKHAAKVTIKKKSSSKGPKEHSSACSCRKCQTKALWRVPDVYTDFRQPSQLRTVPVVVEGEEFFVDHVHMGRLSSVFDVLLRPDGQFREARDQRVYLPLETAADFLLLLKTTCPYEMGLYTQKINGSSVLPLLMMCDRYLIEDLFSVCIEGLFSCHKEIQSQDLIPVLFFIHKLTERIGYFGQNDMVKKILRPLILRVHDERAGDLEEDYPKNSLMHDFAMRLLESQTAPYGLVKPFGFHLRAFYIHNHCIKCNGPLEWNFNCLRCSKYSQTVYDEELTRRETKHTGSDVCSL